MVFANKQDMDQAMTPTEVANSLGLPALKDRKWQIFKTSATKGTGLDEAMEWYELLYIYDTVCYKYIEETPITFVLQWYKNVFFTSQKRSHHPI